MGEFSKKLSLLIASLFLSLLFAEMLIRVLLPQDKMVTWIEMHESGFVMNQSGGDSFQELNGERAIYSFSKEGLRGDSPDLKKENVLLIGDSFTFGLLLQEEHTFVYKLQALSDSIYKDSYKFLNGGTGGAGLADWPLWLEHKGTEIQPDYLIYFLNYDDINRALSKNLFILDKTTPDSLIRSQRWKPTKAYHALNQKKWYNWLQAHSELANLIIKVLWKNIYFHDLTSGFNPDKTEVPIPFDSDFSPETGYSTKLGDQLLKELENWCFTNNCSFKILTTGFYAREDISEYDEQFYKFMLNSEWKENEIFHDITPCLQNNLEGDILAIQIPNDSHPNEKGAQIIANCAWEILVNELRN